jgi:hypothetical protein
MSRLRQTQKPHLSLSGGSLMRDFLFAHRSGKERTPAAPVGFFDAAAAIPRGLRGSISRTMIPKFVAAISARQQHRPCQGSRTEMPHAIIRGAVGRSPLTASPAAPIGGRLRLRRGNNGRRYEVDFGDAPIRVEPR